MNEKGFTLLEMLLVLFIVGIFTSITGQMIIKINEEKEIKAFLNQLELDIFTVESLSLKDEKLYYINFSNYQNIYTVRDSTGNPIFTRNVPASLKYDINSYLKRIEYRSGSVNNFGKVIFEKVRGGGKIYIILNIEKGRVKIDEA